MVLVLDGVCVAGRSRTQKPYKLQSKLWMLGPGLRIDIGFCIGILFWALFRDLILQWRLARPFWDRALPTQSCQLALARERSVNIL